MSIQTKLSICTLSLWLISSTAAAQATSAQSTDAQLEPLPPAIANAPAVIPIIVSLPLEQASAIVNEALRVGRQEGMLPLTVIVLDSGGHMVAVKREDGSGIFRIEVANAKAYGALGMGISTRVLGQRLEDRPVFAASINGLSDGRWVPVPGGVLIRNDQGQIIGSVGVSGDTSDRDEFTAINAVKAAGYWPEPLEPNTAWRDSHL